MRRKGQTKDRPEEKLAYQILKTHLKKLDIIENQKRVCFNDINFSDVDISFTISSGEKYAVRLMGEYHDEGERSKIFRHDRIQLFYLEEKGYIVIDFWYHKMTNLFLRRERQLSEEELREAFLEVKMALAYFGLDLKPYNSNLINHNK